MKRYFLTFSDSNWDWVDEKTKSMMQLEKKPDGEFWMNFKEFCSHFQEVTICTLGPDFDGDGEADKIGKLLKITLYRLYSNDSKGIKPYSNPLGHMEIITGQWIQGHSAGGSRNDLEMFATNPQYILTLTEPGKFSIKLIFEYHPKRLFQISLPLQNSFSTETMSKLTFCFTL